MEKKATVFVAGFIGSPAMNVLPGATLPLVVEPESLHVFDTDSGKRLDAA